MKAMSNLVFREAALRKNSIILLLLLVFFSSLVSGCGCNDEPSQKDEGLENLAELIVDFMISGDFSSVSAKFDEEMKSAVSEEELEEAWNALVSGAGPFKSKKGVRMEIAAGFDVAYITCRFGDSLFDIKLVFSENREISGLLFLPADSSIEYEAPSYADESSFTERDMMVINGEWKLPGTLTLPVGQGPFRAVVLVHGSGPNDRDETLGPNKPFKDIAWGLASDGIAVLRYEKRTKEYQSVLLSSDESITLEEETVSDAVAAVSVLAECPEIASDEIFVLGHSLGGMAIPRIAARCEDAAGFIIMAGPTRPFEDLLLDQYRYIFSLDGEISDQEQAQLELFEKQAETVKSPLLSSDTPSIDLPSGLSAEYWLYLRDYDQVSEAKNIKRPVLIMQGERDYQVTAEDFAGWQNGLSEMNNVSFILYNELNHLFIKGSGKSAPSEYEIAGNVAEEVIKDIANFILHN